MLEILGILSGVIALYSSYEYIKDILKGNTKPHRIAWIIFITLSGISFFAQLAEGATNSLWVPAVLFTQAIIIFALSIKRGIGGFSTYNIISLVLSVLIMIVWVITKSPAIAIMCTVSVNTIGKIMVAIKVYKLPHSEYLPTWLYSVVASILSAMAVGKMDWILLLTPVQNALTVGIIAAIIYQRRKILSKNK